MLINFQLKNTYFFPLLLQLLNCWVHICTFYQMFMGVDIPEVKTSVDVFGIDENMLVPCEETVIWKCGVD